MLSATEAKRAVVGPYKATKADPARLFVNEHDGRYWASNSYWLVGVEKVAMLLGKFDLPTAAAASYAVNGTVEPTEQEPPNFGPLFPVMGDCGRLSRVQVGGRDAFTENPAGGYLAMFEREDGELVGINADFLAFVCADVKDPVLWQHRRGSVLAVVVTDGDLFTYPPVGLVMPVRF